MTHRNKRARTSESAGRSASTDKPPNALPVAAVDGAAAIRGRRADGDPGVSVTAQAPAPVQVEKDSGRFKKFQSMLVRLFSSARTDELSVAQVEEEANKIGTFSRGEIEAMLNELEFENKIMFRDDVVHQI